MKHLTGSTPRLGGGISMGTMLVVALLSSEAAADSIRFCIEINAEYADSAKGEDYWTQVWSPNAQSYPRPYENVAHRSRFEAFRGGYVEVYEGQSSSGKKLWDAYLGDGSRGAVGCTGWMHPTTTAGNYYIRVRSRGRVQGNYYRAIDRQNKVRSQGFVRSFPSSADGKSHRVWLFIGRYPADPNASQSQKDERQVFQLGNALAFSLARDNLGQAGRNIYIRAEGNDTDSSRSMCDPLPPYDPGFFTSDPRAPLVPACLEINFGNSDNKFVVSHELGHLMARFVMGMQPTTNYGFFYEPEAGGKARCANGSGHRLSSVEYNSAGLWEGLAHAYATKVWNGTGGPAQPYLAWSGTRVNVHGATRGGATNSQLQYPQPYLETRCTDVGSFSGLGNEVDWLRTFWSIHTGSGVGGGGKYGTAGGVVAFRQIVDALGAAEDWSARNAYSKVNALMRSRPSNDKMRNRWQLATSRNGVDH